MAAQLPANEAYEMYRAASQPPFVPREKFCAFWDKTSEADRQRWLDYWQKGRTTDGERQLICEGNLEPVIRAVTDAVIKRNL